MKKRLLSLLLVLVMLMGVMAGCSGKETPQATESPSVTNKPAADGGEETVEKTKITFMGWGTDADTCDRPLQFSWFLEKSEVYSDVSARICALLSSEHAGHGGHRDLSYAGADRRAISLDIWGCRGNPAQLGVAVASVF